MFRSFTTFLCAAALANLALAQSIYIAQPTQGANLTAGSSITVQLDKPDSLTGSEDISVVIGAFPCPSGVCAGASEVLGDILYSGPYTSTYHPDNYEPYENFTVTVPSWYSGLVQLGVAHFYLLGAGFSPILQVTNVTVNVAAAASG